MDCQSGTGLFPTLDRRTPSHTLGLKLPTHLTCLSTHTVHHTIPTQAIHTHKRSTQPRPNLAIRKRASMLSLHTHMDFSLQDLAGSNTKKRCNFTLREKTSEHHATLKASVKKSKAQQRRRVRIRLQRRRSGPEALKQKNRPLLSLRWNTWTLTWTQTPWTFLLHLSSSSAWGSFIHSYFITSSGEAYGSPRGD